MIKKCIECKKEFEIQWYREKTAKYCSRQCMGKDKNSNWYGKRFKNGHVGHNKGVNNRMEKECLICNRKFKTYLKRMKYCSHKCYWIDLRNRVGDKTSNWQGGKKRCIDCNKQLSVTKCSNIIRCRKCMFKEFMGEKHWRYIKDRTQLVISERKDLNSRYKDWALRIKNRDYWKCKIDNKDCRGRLEAHHILDWKNFMELRYDINNGITLCHAHHPRGRAEEKRLVSEFQGLVSVSKEQF